MAERVVYRFEDIGADLPLLPLAARRALDAAGYKLSLKAWQALPHELRHQLTVAGSGAEVDLEAVVQAVADAEPSATRMDAADESRLELPGAELSTACAESFGDGALDEALWQRLTLLERFALAHLAKPARRGRLREAYREIVGSTPATKPALTHLNERGEAHMVNVGDKAITRRRALAVARVRMKPASAQHIVDVTGPKGDVLATARIAGIMAAKRTSELIPLCHAIALTRVAIAFDVDVAEGRVTIKAAVDAEDRTGVEMEAMTAASVAALTIYDMLKAVERGIVIEQVVLLEKMGGRSGHYRREPTTDPPEAGG
jgi:cyclic pyranopterin phosphate synthase